MDNDQNARDPQVTVTTRLALAEDCLAKDEAVLRFARSATPQTFKRISSGSAYISVIYNRWLALERGGSNVIDYTLSTPLITEEKPLSVKGNSIQHGSCQRIDDDQR
jgi:hypothetical protein